jgi:hypothetical protein
MITVFFIAKKIPNHNRGMIRDWEVVVATSSSVVQQNQLAG